MEEQLICEVQQHILIKNMKNKIFLHKHNLQRSTFQRKLYIRSKSPGIITTILLGTSYNHLYNFVMLKLMDDNLTWILKKQIVSNTSQHS